MDPVTLDQLKVFIAVVEEGSFSAAGRRLHRAQSAISYAIGNLERLLDLQLFDRTSRYPTLTPAGRALLADARAVSAELDRLLGHAAEMAGGVEPRVSVAVDGLFPIEPLLDALDVFRAEFPSVEVMLQTEALGAVVQLVLDDICQLGIAGPYPSDQLALHRTELASIELIPVAAASHELASVEGPIDEPTLQRHTQLVISDRSPLTAGQDFGVVSTSTWRLADLSTKHACLRKGFGWGAMPRHLIQSDLDAGVLVPLDIASQAAGGFITHYLIKRQHAAFGPAARWLEAYLRDELPSGLTVNATS